MDFYGRSAIPIETVKIKSPFCMLLSASSGTGKTTFCVKMLEYWDRLVEAKELKKIILFYRLV